MNAISLLIILTLLQVLYSLDTNESKSDNVITIDIEWVLQGFRFSFTGFLVEFLGYSSGLRKTFPFLRMTQSSFYNTYDDYPVKNLTLFFTDEVFPKEGNDGAWLYSREQVDIPLDYQYHIKSKFWRPIQSINDTICSPALSQDDAVSIEINNVTIIDKGVYYTGGNMARSFVRNASSPYDCCLACLHQPVCLGWSYVSNNTIDMNHLHQVSSRNGCHLKRSNDWNKSVDDTATSGYFSSSVKLKVPRVVIFHGTSCIHDNATLIKNDPNVISIGRYMLERNPLKIGMNLDERYVFYCASIVDEIWVPSAWHVDIFKEVLLSFGTYNPTIFVIPEAVDTTLFDPNLYNSNSSSSSSSTCVTEDNNENSDKFKFLSIFKWEYRKGWDLLLSAYWNAFSVSDNVELVIRSYIRVFNGTAPNKNITEIIELYAMKNFNKKLNELPSVIWDGAEQFEITRDDVTITREKLRDKLASVDCFVLPTRGEGWGLPIAEAMAMELPVIVTNCTGTTAYLSEENSYPVPILDGVDDEGYIKPDVNILISNMRQVVIDSKNGIARQKGIAARKTMKSLSPEYITSLMAERLRYHVLRRGWDI